MKLFWVIWYAFWEPFHWPFDWLAWATGRDTIEVFGLVLGAAILGCR
jgi:hypothetical protein